MKPDFTLSENLQKVLEAFKESSDVFKGISKSLNISPQLTEVLAKISEVQSVTLPFEVLNQIKKISALSITNDHAIGIIPTGGYSSQTYESNFHDFEPSPKLITIVIDND